MEGVSVRGQTLGFCRGPPVAGPCGWRRTTLSFDRNGSQWGRALTPPSRNLCEREDSNLHPIRDMILNHACLPVPPRSHVRWRPLVTPPGAHPCIRRRATIEPGGASEAELPILLFSGPKFAPKRKSVPLKTGDVKDRIVVCAKKPRPRRGGGVPPAVARVGGQARRAGGQASIISERYFSTKTVQR